MENILNNSRRNFLKGIAGVGGLLATSQLPAFGRGKFEQLSIVKVHMPIGATMPFSVLHFSDTHLTLAYDHEDPLKQKLKRFRTETFGGRQEEALRDTLAWAKDNTDYVLHTGDLIDWLSEANLDAVKKYTGNHPAFFGSMGNHEFSQYMWLKKAVEDENYKAASAEKLQKAYPFNIRFDSRVVNGINFVSMDDVYNAVRPWQIELFKKEVKEGLPIILLMHCPIMTEGIQRANDKYWKYGSKFRNVARTPMKYDSVTQGFIDYLKKEPLLRGILAGHLHVTVQERFSPTAVQYVIGGNYGFIAEEVSFT